jgi:hypothetical protein
MPLPAQAQPSAQGMGQSTVQGMTPGGARPPLPQRTQQARLAPQLQLSAQPQTAAHEEHGDHGDQDYPPTLANPALMAAYRRGVRAAEEQTDRYGG